MGFDAAEQQFWSSTPVDIPDDFPDTFYTAQVADGFVYNDGTRLKWYYVNQDRDQVAYEAGSHSYDFYGDEGSKIRFSVPEEEFTKTDEPYGVTYTYSGNTYFVSENIENVIFDGWSGIVDPAEFMSDIEFSVSTDFQGSAVVNVSGYVDTGKLEAQTIPLLFDTFVWSRRK